jgi:hypothetical protein
VRHLSSESDINCVFQLVFVALVVHGGEGAPVATRYTTVVAEDGPVIPIVRAVPVVYATPVLYAAHVVHAAPVIHPIY